MLASNRIGCTIRLGSRYSLTAIRSLRDGSVAGHSRSYASPIRCRASNTHQPGSHCPGLMPRFAELGKAWCLLCQLSPTVTNAAQGMCPSSNKWNRVSDSFNDRQLHRLFYSLSKNCIGCYSSLVSQLAQFLL